MFLPILLAVLHSSLSSSIHDPFRAVVSRGKPVSLSSTDGSHIAECATDGDYNNDVLPLNCSKTTVSDNPYLQVDLQETKYVNFLRVYFPVDQDPPKVYANIKVTFGPDASPGNNPDVVNINAYHGVNNIGVKKFGRYLTIQRLETNVELSVCEVAAIELPAESIAFRKDAYCSGHVIYQGEYRAVDWNYGSKYQSKTQVNPWFAVDIRETHLIHEVMIITLEVKVPETVSQMRQMQIMIGDHNARERHLNSFCTLGSLANGEIGSFYCDLFGRYVSIESVAQGPVQLMFTEILVNPEKSENVARQTTIQHCNLDNGCGNVVDGQAFSMMTNKLKPDVGNIIIDLGQQRTVTMVDMTIDKNRVDGVEIRIGATGATFEESVPCAPESRDISMSDRVGYFFCQQRLVGNLVLIRINGGTSAFKIHEIAVYEETKPKFADLATDRYVWGEQGVTLTCDAKGYPTPLTSWVKDTVAIERNQTTLHVNQSGDYECWANNKYGVDARHYHVTISSGVRVCTDHTEIEHALGSATDLQDFVNNGAKWYRIFDPKRLSYLQIGESGPCKVWLNGNHPTLQEGVVKRVLCVKNETNTCSTTIDVNIRQCAAHYIYNIRNLNIALSEFCFKNGPDFRDTVKPVLASPRFKHVLSGSVFHTEHDVLNSYQCFVMCQLVSTCKSFNFAQTLKKCELNTGTRHDKNILASPDYDYFELSKGVALKASEEL